MAKFEKRHYLAIAEALHAVKPRRFHDGAEFAAWEICVLKILGVFEADNPNFQADRFLLACNDGIRAKYVRAGMRGGPAMPYRSNDDWRWHP